MTPDSCPTTPNLPYICPMNLQERDKAVIWHPFTHLKSSPAPIPIVKGEGVYLIDDNGKKYIDAISSWWVNLHGHGNEYIAEKIYRQALQLEQVIFAGFTHQPAIDLAERLLQVLPGNFSKIFYSDNGSTSTEVALKMAIQFWWNKNEKSRNILENAQAFLANKKANAMDTPEIRAIKGLIRRCEAKATCKYVGLKEGQWHFQNLPFYETGTIEKKPMGKEDVDITVELLRKIKPHQVYCAGDFADPHGTHIVCFNVVLSALKQCKEEGDEWAKDCWLWLYKGAWQEWNMEDIEMAIPMSPDQVMKKRYGIFIHQSQKDAVPFQGSDAREFWQRAEERNAATANTFAALGMTKYAAMEAFVRWQY